MRNFSAGEREFRDGSLYSDQNGVVRYYYYISGDGKIIWQIENPADQPEKRNFSRIPRVRENELTIKYPGGDFEQFDCIPVEKKNRDHQEDSITGTMD